MPPAAVAGRLEQLPRVPVQKFAVCAPASVPHRMYTSRTHPPALVVRAFAPNQHPIRRKKEAPQIQTQAPRKAPPKAHLRRRRPSRRRRSYRRPCAAALDGRPVGRGRPQLVHVAAPISVCIAVRVSRLCVFEEEKKKKKTRKKKGEQKQVIRTTNTNNGDKQSTLTVCALAAESLNWTPPRRLLRQSA